MTTRRFAALVAAGVAGALGLAGCGADAPVTGVSPSVPVGLDALPVTPLPAERNGIEVVPAAAVPAAILDAVAAQTSVEVTGALERTATQEDGSVERTPLAFTLSGSDVAYDATVTWDDATVALSRDGESWWLGADAPYADALGRPDSVDLCLAEDDPLRERWEWLDGADALLGTVLGEALLGGAEVSAGGAIVTFQVVAGGAVVGELDVSGVGDPVPLLLTVDDPSGSAEVEFSEWSAVADPSARGCGGGATQ
ncbi:hypothetical protein [Demequina sp. NBRC 110053]|uniref:hypothetical protein n=1 Tax=Demequina sp. NBRC 110053 TaxID=1570342 RepID=UPI000A066735|nr:hypothetical protein [Demequina sp. NBRC 110053]